MKLHVTIANTPTGRYLALCDESGEVLPCQTKVTLADQVGDAPRLIVEFVVDGKDLRLVGEQAPTTVNLTLNGGGRYSREELEALFRDMNAALGDGFKLNIS